MLVKLNSKAPDLDFDVDFNLSSFALHCVYFLTSGGPLLHYAFEFSFFARLLPIIIDLVLTRSDYVTLEYGFYYSDCSYSFSLLICFPSQKRLAQST